jgi:hypothetical protein
LYKDFLKIEGICKKNSVGQIKMPTFAIPK